MQRSTSLLGHRECDFIAEANYLKRPTYCRGQVICLEVTEPNQPHNPHSTCSMFALTQVSYRHFSNLLTLSLNNFLLSQSLHFSSATLRPLLPTAAAACGRHHPPPPQRRVRCPRPAPAPAGQQGPARRRILDEAEAAGGFLHFVQPHDDLLDVAALAEQLVDLLLRGVEGEVPHVQRAALPQQPLLVVARPLSRNDSVTPWWAGNPAAWPPPRSAAAAAAAPRSPGSAGPGTG